MYKWCHKSRRNYTFVNLKATKISKRCVFILVTWPWWLPEEWPEACGSLTVVGAGTKHGFGTDQHPIMLTPLGIRQSDWWRAGIRSTNLHIVVELIFKQAQGTHDCCSPWWRHQMETFSAWLALCTGNSPVIGEFLAQRPVTRSFDVFFDLRLNKRFNKQTWGWWFETLSR